MWHHLSGGSWGRELGPRSLWESNKVLLCGETRSEELPAYRLSVCKVSLQLFPWWLLLLSTCHQAIADQNHKRSPNSSWQCLNWDWQQLILKPAKRYKNLTNVLLGGMGLCLWLWPAMNRRSCTVCRAKRGDTHGRVLLSGPPPVQRKHCGSSCLLTKRKCRCPAFLHWPAGWGDSKSMHPASCCLTAEAARCYSHLWGLSRAPLEVEGLLMGPVLYYVHRRD